jgi:hypothetical protein
VVRQFEWSTVLLLMPYLFVVEICLLLYAVSRGWAFVKGYFNVWACLVRNFGSLLEMRKSQQVHRAVHDSKLFDQVDEVVEVTPMLRDKLLLNRGYWLLRVVSRGYLKVLGFMFGIREALWSD